MRGQRRFTDSELLIGGHFDGRRVATDPQTDVLQLPITRRLVATVASGAAGPADMEIECYRRQLLGADGDLVAVWVADHLSMGDAMWAMLRRYPTERP